MGTFAFWQRWLFVVSVLVVAGGIAIALLPGTPLFDVFDDRVNPVFWESETVPPATEDFQQWAYGILGATMAGWGVMMAFIAHYPFKMREKWSWICIAAGVLTWFVIDTLISLSFGVVFNAFAINVPVTVLVLLPLVATREDFFRRTPRSLGARNRRTPSA